MGLVISLPLWPHQAFPIQITLLPGNKMTAGICSANSIHTFFDPRMRLCVCASVHVCVSATLGIYPDSKFHGANMGPIWGRQDPGGPHVCSMNFAIWVWFCEVQTRSNSPERELNTGWGKLNYLKKISIKHTGIVKGSVKSTPGWNKREKKQRWH